MKTLIFLVVVCTLTLSSLHLQAIVSSGDYTIKSALAANKNLDVMWGQNANGVGFHLWDTNNGDAQQFTIGLSNEAGYYNIFTKWGKAVDVAGFNPNAEAAVVTYDSYPQSDNQKWKFIDAGNGYYFIRSKLGTYLDVQYSNINAGTPIWMYPFNGTNAQKWKLEAPVRVLRSTWFVPVQRILQTTSVRINNFTPNRNQYNGSGERAFLKPNDSYFMVTINGNPLRLPIILDMYEGGPDNMCKAYLNDWNSNQTNVSIFNRNLITRIGFESEQTELITDCYNHILCGTNPCPDYELNWAEIELKVVPKLVNGRLSYDSEPVFRAQVREGGSDPCTNNFWAFLCDWGVIPRVGERENRIRKTIENGLKTSLELPIIRYAIESALNTAAQNASVSPSQFRAVSISINGDLLFW